jgi:hypothetical protein
MALHGGLAWRASVRGAGVREARPEAAPAAAAAVGCSRRLAGRGCVAAAAADGAALSPLLTSGNVKRQKVSMMSLGCPKNVVDGAHAGGAACAFCAVLQRTRASPGRSCAARVRCCAASRAARRIPTG